MSGLVGHLALLLARRGLGVTWDPTNKSLGTDLSNENLTATRTTLTGSGTVYGFTLATAGKTSGKWYFEILYETIAADFMPGVGISKNNFPGSADVEFGQSAGGYELRANGGLYANGSVNSSWGPQFTVGDVAMIAFDMDAGRIWFGRNGSWLNGGNPENGTSPASIGIDGEQKAAIVTGLFNERGAATARFAAQHLSYTPPAGFSPYDS